MIEIPFTKLHGAENDFLLTWRSNAPDGPLPELARRICARHTGIGADGWMLIESAQAAGRGTGQDEAASLSESKIPIWRNSADVDAPGESVVRGFLKSNEAGLRTRLFNSDGSEPEISGNGTRCAAALALLESVVPGPEVKIFTAAGPKTLRLIERSRNLFLFEMNMGQPAVEDLHAGLVLAGRSFDAVILNVGNPQCAILVDDFPPDWRQLAAAAEAHPRFPRRSNISFVRPLGRHTLDVRFFERGAGETRSSGTGSTGAAVAAILRDVSASPVEVITPAGSLHIRWSDSVFLTGPAEVIGEGRFFLEL